MDGLVVRPVHQGEVHPLGGEGVRGEGGHRAGPDDHHPLTDQPDALLVELVEGGRHQRVARGADLGVRLHPLADPQALLEELIERRPDGAGVLGAGQRGLHLAEDLVLPDDHRVQPGGDVEQVADGRFVVEDRAVLLEGVRRQAGRLGDPVGNVVQAVVEA
ncbi:hypothetical protein SDC9_122812 [bioreactor metagenome]|uniref:Uncharacterized protein n=1 Tax=bioreactor metagenome TaxID=1076179 RepID=A0A645CG01_9ZZZZ